jgi:hypothetical protein
MSAALSKIGTEQAGHSITLVCVGLLELRPSFSDRVKEAEEDKRPYNPVREDLSRRNMFESFPIEREDSPGNIGRNGIPRADYIFFVLNIHWNFLSRDLSNRML